jgi:V/A-type H+-transporting ATPase subunit I
MFLPLEMKKALIGVHESYLSDAVAALHEAGILEITNIWESEDALSGDLGEVGRASELDRCIEDIQKLEVVREILAENKAEERVHGRNRLFPSQAEKVAVERRGFREVCMEVEHIMPQTQQVMQLNQEIGVVSDSLKDLQIHRAALILLSPLDVDLCHLGESAFLFTVPVSWDARMSEEVEEQLSGAGINEMHIARTLNADLVVAVITVFRENRELLLHVLREQGIRPLEAGPGSGRPEGEIAAIDEKIADLVDRQNHLIGEIRRTGEVLEPQLLCLLEELNIEKERLLSHINFGRTEKTFVIEGWIASRECGNLEDLCSRATGGHAFCRIEEPDEHTEEVPTEYDNPAWLRPFEMITTMFSRPRYGEIDPTIFTAPLFIAFFALMLGDAVYGGIITVIGLLLRRVTISDGSAFRDMGTILLVAGCATIVSGVLQGGYMGDVLPRFLGVDPPVLISALESPIEFLRIALVIGIVQINLGLVIAAYQNYRNRRFRNMLHEQISWFFIQPAATVLLFDFFGWSSVSQLTRISAGLAALVGIILLFTNEGPLGFFSLTGFLGDWLSYARLLALALATGGIAMTVNILAQMVSGSSMLLNLVAILIFIVGQTFNLVLQTLGAFIHSLRLQFVEFFGKFYTGGGKGFSPFYADRKITRLKEGGW